jgi:hypothetical protein
MITHEDKDSVCILLPALGDFIIFFLCHVHVHLEDGPRPIRKTGTRMVMRRWMLC